MSDLYGYKEGEQFFKDGEMTLLRVESEPTAIYKDCLDFEKIWLIRGKESFELSPKEAKMIYNAVRPMGAPSL